MESDNGALKKDAPISFESNYRQYGYRSIKDMPCKVIYKAVLQNETLHDPMKELG